MSKYEFDGAQLSNAIKETFLHRGTKYDDIVVFEDGFTNDPIRQTRWNGFIKKKKAMIPVEFSEVVSGIKQFLKPVVEEVINEKELNSKWDVLEQQWK